MSTAASELDELTPDATPDVPLREPGEPAPDKRKAPAPRRRGKKQETLEPQIREMLKAIGAVWHATEASRDHAAPTCGAVMVQQAPAIAKSLNAVAMDDPSVYRWLHSLTMMGGGWGAVAFATLPIVQSVVGRHVIPAIENRRYRGTHEVEFGFEEGDQPSEGKTDEGPEEPWSPPNEIA